VLEIKTSSKDHICKDTEIKFVFFISFTQISNLGVFTAATIFNYLLRYVAVKCVLKLVTNLFLGYTETLLRWRFYSTEQNGKMILNVST